MGDERRRQVIDVLEAEGPQLPIVVLARLLAVPPSHLVRVLDDLFDEGLVTAGRERGTVALVPQQHADDGRFKRPQPERAPR